MAQPLATLHYSADSRPLRGIDEAGARLEQAFARLEAAASRVAAGGHSLKAENEKLNDLLQEADDEVTRLKLLALEVSGRIDHTIAALERGSLPLHS